MARGTTKPLLRRHKRKTAVRNWLDLPNDLTFMIFSRLTTFDILTSVQQMCHHTIDRSCGQLVDISIEYFGTDNLLKYIIDSQGKLRRLQLVQCFYTIFDEGLCEIAQKLPLLKEFEIILCKHITCVALEAIGRGCPLLKSLKFNHNGHSKGDNEDAVAIAQNMPNLRHLQLIYGCLDNDGVSAILDGCRFFESLDLRWCYNVNLEGRLRKMCDEQLKDFIEPNTLEGFSGYKFGKLCNANWYEDLEYTYRPRKKMFGHHIAENESQDNGEFSEEEKEEEEEKMATNWDEIYDIWEC
ncbi:putative F-box/LRR-repeat protein 23 [Arachis ipaensis]|nr:putative F-box/LRR-repeat protein 23 [Arachis ipaensis]XP_029151632.1 putative F-box/LRR-repeat protein 23 [Arachis hypogaea]